MPVLPAFLLPGVGPKSIMDARQGSIPSPDPEHMEDRFVGRKTLGQQVPVTTSLGDIQQSVHDESKRSSCPTRLSWLGQHRFAKHPLSIGEVGGRIRILHCLETRCRGDVGLSGSVPNQCLSAEPCCIPEGCYENTGFEFSDGPLKWCGGSARLRSGNALHSGFTAGSFAGADICPGVSASQKFPFLPTTRSDL